MERIERVMRSFSIYGDYIHTEPYGNGHINHTYRTAFDQAGRRVYYLFQQINREVFKNPEDLMDNVSRICDHLVERSEAEGFPDSSRRVLTLVRTRDGESWARDDEGEYWRCYFFIEGALGHDVVQNAAQAREAARCFGEYLRLLADLPGTRLSETIPGFHDTPARFEALMRAASEDEFGLADSVAVELDFFADRAGTFSTLIDACNQGLIPERVTHNDTKLNNVLIDEESLQGVCVIDLDTSMPGLSPYDFGDLVRSSTSPVPEDHRSPGDVRMDFMMFAALADGFLEPGRKFLNEKEISLLPEGGRLMTMEVGMRFLTDYLSGNRYFKTAYHEHNLVRCRSQIALAASIEEQMGEMQRHVEKLFRT